VCVIAYIWQFGAPLMKENCESNFTLDIAKTRCQGEKKEFVSPDGSVNDVRLSH
jgi:hypothetical protein